MTLNLSLGCAPFKIWVKQKEMKQTLEEAARECRRTTAQSMGVYAQYHSIDECPNHGITYDEIAIDCGANEELFLSIASLRDDTDKYQWFIMDVEIYVYIPKGTWFQSTDRNGGRHVGTQIESLYCHKATVEELIEHFNKS